MSKPVKAILALRIIRQENQRLRQENMALFAENSNLREAFQENIRLRKVIGFAPLATMQYKPAKVIGFGNSPVFNTVIINSGSRQGIQENMTLICAEGLVGKIVKVSPNYSVAQLVIDRNFGAAARVQRSRETGIFIWTSADRGLLTQILNRADVKVGDTVITTGHRSLFPPGIKIGIVTEVEEDPKGLFKRIVVLPDVNFRNLEEVFVIERSDSLATP